MFLQKGKVSAVPESAPPPPPPPTTTTKKPQTNREKTRRHVLSPEKIHERLGLVRHSAALVLLGPGALAGRDGGLLALHAEVRGQAGQVADGVARRALEHLDVDDERSLDDAAVDLGRRVRQRLDEDHGRALGVEREQLPLVGLPEFGRHADPRPDHERRRRRCSRHDE
jgi:hypothetical protein